MSRQSARQQSLEPACYAIQTLIIKCRHMVFRQNCVNFAGEKQGHSLLARDSPSLWYEAAESLAPLPATTGEAAAITEEAFEAKKQTAIAALQNEEAVFERDLG